MSRRMALALVSAALLAGLPASCGGATSPPQPAGGRITVASDDPSLPYGIVAIDYHFHDAHPSLPISPDRTVLFTNQGTVKHNVTFDQLDFSRDFDPGQAFTIKDLGRKLGGPGVYTFYCAYHYASFGMQGTIIVQ
jgi:plastocyanin